MNLVFTVQQVFQKWWEYGKELYTCFLDLEKAYSRVPRNKLWAVLLKYDVRGQLLAAIESLYKQSEVCVHLMGMKTKTFCQGCGSGNWKRKRSFFCKRGSESRSPKIISLPHTLFDLESSLGEKVLSISRCGLNSEVAISL